MSIDLDLSLDADLRILGDPLRWQIVELLSTEELCGCHLVEDLGVAQSLISHHLKVLRDAGFVTTSRERYWTYYRLEPDRLATIGNALARVTERAAAGGRDRRPCC